MSKCGSRVVLPPDFLSDGKEISHWGKVLDNLAGEIAFAHHRHLYHIGPPFEQLALCHAPITKR